MERDPREVDAGPEDDTGSENLLSGLDGRLAPPPALEERVAGELRRGGLLGAGPAGRAGEPGVESVRRLNEGMAPPRARGGGRRRWALPLAAALVGAVVGWGVATLRTVTAPSAAGEGRLFVLVFTGGPQEGEELARSIRANGDWAHNVLADRFLGGRKLLPEGAILSGGEPPRRAPEPRREDLNPVGFFLIRARDLEEATSLGQKSPHLAFGGHLIVRPVDDLRWVYSPAGQNG